jgi:hypothetical protein
MKLTEPERQSALWEKISKELAERLDVLRQKNDGNLTADETAKVRGEIAAIKNIQNWAVTDPKIT